MPLSVVLNIVHYNHTLQSGPQKKSSLILHRWCSIRIFIYLILSLIYIIICIKPIVNYCMLQTFTNDEMQI